MWLAIIGGMLLLLFLFVGRASRGTGAVSHRPQTRSLPPKPVQNRSHDWIRPGLSINSEIEKFAVSRQGQPSTVFAFNELVAVEIERDDRSVSKTNRGSQVAGAAAGALLLGPAGLLLGGLTGSKRHEQKVKRITIKLYTSHLANPVVEFAFLNSWVGLDANSFGVKAAARNADQWYGRFRAILHGQEQARLVGLQHQLDAANRHDDAPPSVIPVDLGQNALDKAAARKASDERTKALVGSIEYRRLRRANQAKLEPAIRQQLSDAASSPSTAATRRPRHQVN